MKLLVTRRAYWCLVHTRILVCTLNTCMHMLDCRIMTEVLLLVVGVRRMKFW